MRSHQAQHAYDDEIQCDDVIQQPGYDQDENAGDERDDGSCAERNIHVDSFPVRFDPGYAQANSPAVIFTEAVFMPDEKFI